MEVARLQALTFFLVTKLSVSWASVNLGKGGRVKTIINTTALEPFARIQCFTGILRNIQHSACSKLEWNMEISLASCQQAGLLPLWRSSFLEFLALLHPTGISPMISVHAFGTFNVVYLFFR